MYTHVQPLSVFCALIYLLILLQGITLSSKYNTHEFNVVLHIDVLHVDRHAYNRN